MAADSFVSTVCFQQTAFAYKKSPIQNPLVIGERPKLLVEHRAHGNAVCAKASPCLRKSGRENQGYNNRRGAYAGYQTTSARLPLRHTLVKSPATVKPSSSESTPIW